MARGPKARRCAAGAPSSVKLDSGAVYRPARSPAHWEALAATDFFTVEVLKLHGLIRYHVLFVIELSTRKIEIVGITVNPTGAWLKQVARNLVDDFLIVRTASG